MKEGIINIKDWQIMDNIAAGHGTREKAVLRRTKKSKAYFIVKSYGKDIGELRSEVCASNIGEICNFSVQKTNFCIIPQYKELGFSQEYGVLIRLDITRQRDPRVQKFKEDLLHGIDLIAGIDPHFIALPNESVRRRAYTLDLVLDSIRVFIQKKLKGRKRDAAGLWESFFQLIVFDALIGGTDRHYRNWGVLIDADKKRGRSKGYIRLSPAFDNGISLLWKKENRLKNLNIHSLYAAPSAFRRVGGGQYKLFELCKALLKVPEIIESGAIQRTFEKLQAITDLKLTKAILQKVPKDERFESSEKTLGMVKEYVTMRLKILMEILYEYA